MKLIMIMISLMLGLAQANQKHINFTNYDNDPKLNSKFRKCYDELPTTFELEEELLKMSPRIGQRINVLGVELDDHSPEVLRSFMKLFEAYYLYKDDSLITKKSLTEFTQTCDNVICLAKEVFGEFHGIAILYIQMKYNINLSPYGYSRSHYDGSWEKTELGRFSERELKVFLTALKLLPLHFFSNFQNKDAKKINAYKGYTLANATMQFFTLWSTSKNVDKFITVIHELAHNIENGFSVDDEEHSEKHEYKMLHLYEPSVSQYGKTNSTEDFAEAFTAYVLTPDFLKRRSLERYNFLREKVFLGREYSNNMCGQSEKNSNLVPYFREKLRVLESRYHREELSEKCSDELSDHIFYSIETPLLRCIAFNIQDDHVAESYSPEILDMIRTNEDYKTLVKFQVDYMAESARNTFTHSDYLSNCSAHPTLMLSEHSSIKGYSYKIDSENICRWLKSAYDRKYPQPENENIDREKSQSGFLNFIKNLFSLNETQEDQVELTQEEIEIRHEEVLKELFYQRLNL